MLLLARTSLQVRWRAYVGVFLTIATAVTLVAACGILLESGIRANVAPERLAGAPVIVAGQQTAHQTSGSGDDAETSSSGLTERVRTDAALAGTIRRVEGVRAVLPEVSFPAYLLGRDGSLVGGPDGAPSLGHGWDSAALTPFDLTSGHAPRAPGEVVVDSGTARRADVATGDRLTLVAAGTRLRATVVGIARDAHGPLAQQAAVFFTATQANRLYARPGQVDAFGVLLDHGASVDTVAARLRAALGTSAQVATGDGRGAQEFLDGADAGVRLIAISGSLGGIGLSVAVFVVAGMLALVVQQRHREIALLRAIAATPRQVRRLVALETFLVTLPAAAAGVWPGRWLAAALDNQLKAHGVLPGTFRHAAGQLPVLVAVAAALLVVQVAAYVAGRRASKVRPTEALASAALPRVRIGVLRGLFGVLSLGGTVALVIVTENMSAALAPAVTPGLVLLLILDVALFAPLLAAVGVRLLALPARWSGVGGYLADLNTRAYARRLASAMTPIVLTVGIAGMTVFQTTTVSAEASRQGHQRLLADRVVAGGDAGLRVESVSELGAAPGVRTALGLLPTTVLASGELDPYPAQGVTGGRLRDVLDLDVRHGSVAALRHDRVALSTELAASLHATVGQQVPLRLGDGTRVAPTLVATYYRSRGFADALLPLGDVRAHVTSPVLSSVLLRIDGPARQVDATLAALHREQPAARTGGGELIRAVEDADAATQAWIGIVLLGLVIVFVSLAVVNTLVLSTADRSREFALLRLVGLTKRQVLRMMRWESTIVVSLGCLLGAAVAAGTLMPFSKATTGSYHPSLPLDYAAAIIASAVVVAMASMLLPTRLALRSRPVDAIGMRE